VCVWEAESIRDVKAFLESYIGHVSKNLYFQIENRESVGVPSEVQVEAPPALQGEPAR